MTYLLRMSFFCCNFAAENLRWRDMSLHKGGFSDILNSVY